jgi:hypothetical protein
MLMLPTTPITLRCTPFKKPKLSRQRRDRIF